MELFIKTLKEISENKITNERLIESFDQLAKTLLKEVKIVTLKNEYKINEIEFYFNNQLDHDDPFTHENIRQGIFGQWYFHRFKNVEPYQSLRRKGLDITFGSMQHQTFGGILIRKIQNLQSNIEIQGVGILVQEIMKDYSNDQFELIAKSEIPQEVFSKEHGLYLDKKQNEKSEIIYKGYRKNLGDATEDPNDFKKKKYNYFINNEFEEVK